MRRQQVFVWALALALLCAGAVDSAAQGLTGQLSGTVVDGSRAVLPGVMVTVKNEATATVLTTVASCQQCVRGLVRSSFVEEGTS